ncbi:MAG: 4Fe-4S dicluster domain-containing protein [Mariprofundus sp.]|nr:4Fe-4S dicluster domain-containing protein [Mariprofundus sp.]
MVVAACLPFGIARLLSPTAEPVSHKSGRSGRMQLRPPGALRDDHAFMAACISCGLCAEVCPPKCIQFHLRDGGSSANTPYIVPEEKSCILCMKCGEVCPTNALEKIAYKKEEIIKQVNMGIAQIDRLTCYPWVNTGICGACGNICPLGKQGIRFEFAGIYRPLVQDGCVGCGQCVEVCPHPSLPIRVVASGMQSIAPHTLKSGSLPF